MSEMVDRVAARLMGVGLLFDYSLSEIEAERLARAAIEAMREPTEAMDNAGAECGPDRGHDTYWEAMIDAALKD